MIDKDAKLEMLATVDLVSLIEQRSPTRFDKPSGNGTKRTAKGACPWCQGTDRFAVFINETPQRYYCGIHGNGCGKHGQALDFLIDYEHMRFNDAVAYLSGDIDTILRRVETRQQSQGSEYNWLNSTWQERTIQSCRVAEARLFSEDDEAGQAVLVYLYERGFNDETIKAAHLGAAMYKGAVIARKESNKVPCLVIPWYDRKKGCYPRVTMRDIRPGIDKKQRYENIKGSSVSEGMYLSDLLQRKLPTFLVEGELDALSIMQEARDLVNVVATGSTAGGQALKWQLKLATMPHVFVAFDAEKTAAQSAQTWLKALDKSTRWHTPIGKDANDMLRQGMNTRIWVEAALDTLVEPAIDETPAAETAQAEQPAAGFSSLEQFLKVVDTIGSQVFGPGCTITLIPKGYTLEQHVARMQAAGAYDNKFDNRQARGVQATPLHQGCTCNGCGECATREQLLAYGAQHNWPRLLVKPWLAIPEGEDHWRGYAVKHTMAELQTALGAA